MDPAGRRAGAGIGGAQGHARAAAMADQADEVSMPAISVFGDAISAGTAAVRISTAPISNASRRTMSRPCSIPCPA
ncbi:hypothetical protein BA896_018885 [Janthinobacterium lividum]|uniref:Uncharacterized protein n=1 Tax=Janthinobacterium lividum TaxID=29581 RepID=A0A1E8PLD4_9BURK|nr:hypothetical protein BA896_018885 [Janthinobacterium lividum]